MTEHNPMSLSQFIRDNTNDGRDIASVLIDVMNGRIDGSGVSHRLTAARLLIIYGYDDADDFIADNTPDSSGDERAEKGWFPNDPVLASLIKTRTDGGRAICLFLIDVVKGRVEGIHVGHRVAAAKELLNRGFGRYQSRPLPKPPGSSAPRRSTHKTHQQVPSAQTQAVTPVPAASTAVLDEPEQQSESEDRRKLLIDIDNDPRFTVFDSELYRFMNECDDPDFDPYLAALDEDYLKSYTNCKDPECEVHGDPPEIDFYPNDFHY